MKNEATTNRGARWARGALLAGAALAGLLSCSPLEEASSVWVHGVIAVTQQELCVARADARTMRLRGTMDTWMRNRFHMFLKIENYLRSTRSAFGELYGENHNVQVLGAHVTYEYPSGLGSDTEKVLSESYYTPSVGFAEPESMGVASVNAIPVDVGNALAAEPIARSTGFPLLVKVRLESRLGDGAIVLSNEYKYPVDICFGCLYMIITDDCSDLGDAGDMRPPCLIGQDEGVDCRLFTLWGSDISEIER